MSRLGKRLRELRQQRGLSERGLAAQGGLSRSEIDQIERGKKIEPELTTLQKLATALGVDLQVLLDPCLNDAREAASNRSEEGTPIRRASQRERMPAEPVDFTMTYDGQPGTRRIERRHLLNRVVRAFGVGVGQLVVPESTSQPSIWLDRPPKLTVPTGSEGLAPPSSATMPKSLPQIVASNLEAQARTASARNDWQTEQGLCLLRAQIASAAGNIREWAQWTTRGAQLAASQSKYADAEALFQRILESPRLSELDENVQLEVCLRLGWLHYEREDYDDAISYLRLGVRRSENLLNSRPKDEVLRDLLEMGRHFLGRALGDRGILKGNGADMTEALDHLKKAYKPDETHHPPAQVGFNLLREVPIYLHSGNIAAARYSLDKAEDLFDVRTAGGYISLHRGLMNKKENQLSEAEDYSGPRKLDS